MTLDLGFVANSTQRHPDELASRSFRDRGPREVLPTPEAPRNTESDLRITHQLPHGEKFKDALLDLLQPIMIFIQHFFRAGDVPDFL